MLVQDKVRPLSIIGWPSKTHARIAGISFLIGLPILLASYFDLLDRQTSSLLAMFFYPITLFGLANSFIVFGRLFTKIPVDKMDLALSLPVVAFYIYLACKVASVI